MTDTMTTPLDQIHASSEAIAESAARSLAALECERDRAIDDCVAAGYVALRLENRLTALERFLASIEEAFYQRSFESSSRGPHCSGLQVSRVATDRCPHNRHPLVCGDCVFEARMRRPVAVDTGVDRAMDTMTKRDRYGAEYRPSGWSEQ